MPSLLNIPFELRDQIITHVYFTTRAPPTSSIVAQQSQREVVKDCHSTSRYFNVCPSEVIKYESGRPNYLANVAPLLCVNNQLRFETETIVNRYPTTYHLDILLLPTRTIWPTWTFVPQQVKCIQTLRMDFRLDEPSALAWKHFVNGIDLHVLPTNDTFEMLFESVLVSGPFRSPRSEIQREDRNSTARTSSKFAVQVLDINVLADTSPAAHDWRAFQVSANVEAGVESCTFCKVIRTAENIAKPCVGDSRLAKAMVRFWNKTTPWNFCKARNGSALEEILMGSVGRVLVRCNGELLFAVDLGLILRDRRQEEKNPIEAAVLEVRETTRIETGLTRYLVEAPSAS